MVPASPDAPREARVAIPRSHSRAPAPSRPAPEAAPKEREVKLAAAPSFRLPDLAGLAEGITVGPQQDPRMETTYYDTADLRLARWGLSLRYRSGEGWTLKLGAVAEGSLLTR